VIHNGVEAACVERSESESPLVLYIGRLNKYKNVDRLIDEFSGVLDSIPSSKLVVAGDGPELRKLRSKVRSKGLEGRVVILGRVSEEKKVALLSSAWVNVTMSDVEGWSISCLEAAAFGTPTVACDVPGLDCSVLDGETGLLIPLGKKGLFEAALRKVLSEPELRGRLSDGAREWSRKFSWDGAAFEFEALCQRASGGIGSKTI
jgi:glycosyltransferase involved in cell wall biosynthesis